MFSVGRDGHIILWMCARASLCPTHASEEACRWMFRKVRFVAQVVVVLGWSPRVSPPGPRSLPAVSCRSSECSFGEGISLRGMGSMNSDRVIVVGDSVLM